MKKTKEELKALANKYRIACNLFQLQPTAEAVSLLYRARDRFFSAMREAGVSLRKEGK